MLRSLFEGVGLRWRETPFKSLINSQIPYSGLTPNLLLFYSDMSREKFLWSATDDATLWLQLDSSTHLFVFPYSVSNSDYKQ